MSVMATIEPAPVAWRSVFDVPVPIDRKDGRDMLLWVRAGYPVLCSWDDAWYDAVGHEVKGAMLWADVTRPG